MTAELSPEKIRRLRKNLLRWFNESARDLPWRRSKDPYGIWLSEIMLQQTRVEAGIRYYERFLKALPTVKHLARATEDRVLKLWEGLGYYSRARNLHRAARVIAKAGAFPESAAGWMALPGVGRYSAGAIASIAFGEPVSVLDGNVKRVFARLFAVEECIDTTATTASLWDLADRLVPRRSRSVHPGDWNEALMELGALICIPGTPRCQSCPLSRQCRARALHMETEWPVRKAKKPVPHREVAAAWIEKGNKVLLGKRRPEGMLAGLWEFPGGTVDSEGTHQEPLAAICEESCGVSIEVGECEAVVDHAYSHFTIRFHLYKASYRSGRIHKRHYPDCRWVSHEEIQDYALPHVDRKGLEAMQKKNRE